MQKDIQLENVTIEEADKVEGGSMINNHVILDNRFVPPPDPRPPLWYLRVTA
jgi:hypothetical protein